MAETTWYTMRSVGKVIIGTERAVALAARLIRISQCFQMTPLPFDNYQFIVKAENERVLHDYCAAILVDNPLEPHETSEPADSEIDNH